MLLRRLPHSFFQVRFMTARRPKYEHAEAREHNAGSRLVALGKREWPALTASPDNLVFSIQQAVFGYDRGGEGFIAPGKKLLPGKKPVPVRTGRKLARKLEAVPRFTEWYPQDLLGKLRFREMRMMKKHPQAQIASYLGPHQVKGYGEEDFGPYQQFTPEAERARRRARAQFVLNAVSVDADASALTSTEQERRRIENIQALRKRGKAAPKKGQGKRASGGKAGKK
jgi:hypothetical protein